MERSIQQNIKPQERRAYWQDHLARWQKSERTATAYCREHQLSVDTFKYWQYRILPETRGSRSCKEFVEVCITERTQHATIETTIEATTILLETPSGYKVHLPRNLSQAELSKLFCCLRQALC